MEISQRIASRAPALLRRVGITVLVVTGILGARMWMRWPDVRGVAHARPARVAVIDRAEIAASQRVDWRWADMRDISPQLALAVLVSEDIEFYQHRGFSWAEIRRALADARAGKRMRGASTITQQLAKNLWLSGERSAGRKVAEAVLTTDLERFAGKRRILELYLNVVPFGPGAFGAESAAQRYFAKPALFLTEDESAMLAAGLTQPSRWNPASTLPDYRARVELIRRRMNNAEFLWRHLLQL
jgi:monofunctional biosynthetic peptidoglycan transglycosylase